MSEDVCWHHCFLCGFNGIPKNCPESPGAVVYSVSLLSAPLMRAGTGHCPLNLLLPTHGACTYVKYPGHAGLNYH